VDSLQHADSVAEKKLVAGLDTTTFAITDSTIRLKNDQFPKPHGRVVNLMITGVDSRLGDHTMHADANHVVRFFLDSGCIEIISIPRDTYADAGFDDTTGFNRLTNVRANRGREEYHNAVKEITGVGRIDYWMEFGFSQAIGLLELLGYRDNASSTLRVLRSRQAFATGDFQRSYNQGQFMRQAMLKNIKHTQTVLGDLALRASLMLVETNLTYDACSRMMEDMTANGFSDDPSRIWVRLEPAIVSRIQALNFDSSNISTLDRQIESRIHKLGLDSVKVTSETYENRLTNLINKAAADSAKSPGSVIRYLKRPFEQRAWLQIMDRTRRIAYRDRLCNMLENAYVRTKKTASAERVREYVKMEDAVRGSN